MAGERDLRKRVAALERRVATLVMTGTAKASEGARTLVEFDAKGADGKPFLSPKLAQASPAGKNGGGVSAFTRIGDGEPVLVFNPGGEIGEHSRVMPAGHVTDHPSPGTAEANGQVIEIGNARFAIKDGELEVSVGSSSIVVRSGEIVLRTPAFRGEQA